MRDQRNYCDTALQLPNYPNGNIFSIHWSYKCQTSCQKQHPSKQHFCTCISVLSNTNVTAHSWKRYTRHAQNQLHRQPEGRLHTALSFQLLIYIIKLRDSQLYFPAIIWVVTRRTEAGSGAMEGPSSQKQDQRENLTGEGGLHWENVWRRCWAGLWYSLWPQHSFMLVLGFFLRV